MWQLIERMPAPLRDVVGSVAHVEAPGQGATSDVVVITGDKGRFVVKRATKPPYTDRLRREHEVLRRRAAALPLAPRPCAYAEEGGGAERWLLMEHKAGEPLRQVLRRVKTAKERQGLLSQFGRALSLIHQDGDAVLLERLSATRPRPVPACFIHGDYTLDNVLVENGRVTAVVDWCRGGQGDPRYDLALATRPKPEAFRDAGDLEAFYAGRVRRLRPCHDRGGWLHPASSTRG